jgi:hypothetical protein
LGYTFLVFAFFAEHHRVKMTTVCLCAVITGFLSMLPYVSHTFYPAFHGLTVERDKDYANYDSRLERALTGHPEEASNAITPIGSGLQGLQVAGVEEVTGALFSWTHLDGPTVSVIVTGLLTPLLFLLFYLLFVALCFPPRWALGMTLVLFGVMFHGLTRVVHPGWSFLPTIGALYVSFLFFQKPTVSRLILAIILLGLMPYIYFWSWTFSWAVVGSFVLLSLFSSPQITILRRAPLFSILLGVGVLLLSIPFVLQTVSLFGNTLYPEVAIRASFLTQRFPESPIRSGLLVLQLLAMFSLFRRYRTDWSYLATLSFLLGITLAMHQNVIHQRVLMFASHYYPHLLIATTVCGAWVLLRKVWMPARVVVAGLSLVFLAAGMYDYAFAQGFFIPQPNDFRDQNLAGVIADLKVEGRQTILTDADTGRVVTSWTDDGIVYTTHARFLLISDKDLVERYCVSELANPEPMTTRVLDLEYNRILQSAAYQTYQKNLITEACARVKADPLTYLKKYGVTMMLWNKEQRPNWVVDPTKLHLQEERSGSGWVLWDVRE